MCIRLNELAEYYTKEKLVKVKICPKCGREYPEQYRGKRCPKCNHLLKELVKIKQKM